MTIERYAAWLRHGRAHQIEGRGIDALLCYRRALREAPNGIDARFHLAEIAWQFGNRSDAIAQWRAVVEQAPEHAVSLHALADACAAAGEFAEAEDAANRLLVLRRNSERVDALAVMLRAARGDAPQDALVRAIGRGDAWPLRLIARVVPWVVARNAGASARADTGDASASAATDPNGMPPAVTALLDMALATPVTVDTEDALRVIACTLAQTGHPAYANAFASRYAQSCKDLHRNAMPLRWPKRAGGDALRVGLLIPADRSDVEGLVGALTSVVGPGRCELMAFIFAQSGVDPGADAATAAANTHPTSSPVVAPGLLTGSTVPMRALPPTPAAAARAIASLDLDVLIDLAGLHESSGPLLALRPARTLWAVETTRVPTVHGLVDHVFHAVAGLLPAGFAESLQGRVNSIATVPGTPVLVTELSSRWEAAVRAHQGGDPAAAAAGYAWVLEHQPGYAPAHYLNAIAARDQGATDAALEGFRAAVTAAPDFADARAALANLMIEQGDATSAATLLREGLAFSDQSPALWRSLGQANLRQGDAVAAAAAYAEALVREPANPESHYNQGVALQTKRDLPGAARAYQRAIAFQPENDAAHFNLGIIFESQGNADAAIAAFKQVLDLAPGHVLAYKALSEALLANGRVDAWDANFRRFEANCPDHLAVATLALEVCAYRADFAKLEHYLEGLRRDRFTVTDRNELLDSLQQLLYLLLFFDVEDELIARYAHMHDALARHIYGEPTPRAEPRRAGKLRIGYLSGDFRNHVMGKMMWEAMRHHDRDQFEIYGFTTTEACDAWTERIKRACEYFETVVPLSDSDAARRIADVDLDVLVDLSTQTKGARQGIIALKPARVQITHVASAGTTSMSTIDFKLTDRYADIAGVPELRLEAPLVMEGCVYPWRRIEPAAKGSTRGELGIASGAVVIGAFCTPLKLSQRCLALWRDVMTANPRVILAFSPLTPALRSTYLHIATTAGIDAQRIVFVPQGRDDAENQARYRIVDFVLDPMPYGGVNGTIEPLAMGVPVVTLVGRRHGERMSYSILVNLGVTETVAQTGREYVDIATRLARSPEFMRDVRAKIAAGLAYSPLTDMPSHTRNLERAYRSAIERRASASNEL